MDYIQIPLDLFDTLLEALELKRSKIKAELNEVEDQISRLKNQRNNYVEGNLPINRRKGAFYGSAVDSKSRKTSWSAKAKAALKSLERPATTAEIVDRIIELYPEVLSGSVERRNVMSSVSATLSVKHGKGLLVDRILDDNTGEYIYTLKTEES